MARIVGEVYEQEVNDLRSLVVLLAAIVRQPNEDQSA